MKGKQWLAMGMAVLLLGSGWPSAPARAESESELRDKLSALERQEQEQKDKAAASKKDLQNRQQHLEDLRAQIDNIVRQVRLLDGELELRQVVNALESLIDRQGLVALCENPSSIPFLARPRRQEIFACFNRCRSLEW